MAVSNAHKRQVGFESEKKLLPVVGQCKMIPSTRTACSTRLSTRKITPDCVLGWGLENRRAYFMRICSSKYLRGGETVLSRRRTDERLGARTQQYFVYHKQDRGQNQVWPGEYEKAATQPILTRNQLQRPMYSRQRT